VPRYFHNEIGGQLKPDDAGLEFPSIEAARVEAVRYAAEALRDARHLSGRRRLLRRGYG